MIEIEQNAWQTMVLHAERTYPNECCGAMLGHSSPEKKVVTEAVALDNAWNGAQGDRYKSVRKTCLLQKRARAHRGWI
jgi:proteasome lid subunit RPN8/RPN11